MSFQERTHLERLIDWSSGAAVRLDPESLHRRWMSVLLPTRRFGLDAWVAFQVATEPQSLNLGQFRAWVVFDARAVRLLAYLEPPLAETFGVIPRFPKPTGVFDQALVPALGRAGAGFFAEAGAGADVDRVRDGLRALDGDYLNALRIAAPDFLAWAGV